MNRERVSPRKLHFGGCFLNTEKFATALVSHMWVILNIILVADFKNTLSLEFFKQAQI